ncbi:MAG: hypothetical protein J6386_05140 [Candidatus Synoicihabitans palmerolidicus]|nr:hypothetical protein [Candidatus Synoicihabitans palmerolidicus]
MQSPQFTGHVLKLDTSLTLPNDQLVTNTVEQPYFALRHTSAREALRAHFGLSEATKLRSLGERADKVNGVQIGRITTSSLKAFQGQSVSLEADLHFEFGQSRLAGLFPLRPGERWAENGIMIRQLSPHVRDDPSTIELSLLYSSANNTLRPLHNVSSDRQRFERQYGFALVNSARQEISFASIFSHRSHPSVGNAFDTRLIRARFRGIESLNGSGTPPSSQDVTPDWLAQAQLAILTFEPLGQCTTHFGPTTVTLPTPEILLASPNATTP